jgi:membrane-associated phospholipid phosphatase
MGGHRARQSILRSVAGAVGRWDAFAASLLRLDELSVDRLNSLTRRRPTARWLASATASWLASVEIALMLALGAQGRRGSVVRMLLAVAIVYVASEALGSRWRRERPFARHSTVETLVAHRPGRSFPSRHVASALAMASIGHAAHPRLGRAMAWLAWLLGLSRVAAGLHYPSDVLAGALLGRVVGRLLR